MLVDTSIAATMPGDPADETRLRTTAARDERRKRIIAVAKNAFFADGYAAASMSRIAAEAGGSKGTLYNYFRSKEELFLAVVRDIVKPPQLLQERNIHDVRSYLERLTYAALELISSPDSISMHRLAASEAMRFPEVGRIFQNAILGQMHMQLAAIFEELMDKSLIRRSDPKETVEVFFDLCSGWFIRRTIWNLQQPPTKADIAQKARSVVTAFLDGFACPSTEGREIVSSSAR